MEPLGTRSSTVAIETLEKWCHARPQPSESGGPQAALPLGTATAVVAPHARCPPSPFPYRDDINGKIALWKGDVAHLNCNVIVCPTNEHLNDKNAVSDSVHALAGPQLHDELRKLNGCRTGEAKMTKAFGLAARFIVHTVGPRYNSRYRTAAETSLHGCYKRVLHIATENRLNSVGLCVINTPRRGFPAADAAHIALRTVRRFLENHGESISTIVFAVMDQDEAVYLHVLPLYFPRSLEEEAWALSLLPYDIGNAEGEPVVAERQIRITDKPGQVDSGSESDGGDDASDDSDRVDGEMVGVGAHAFARMEGDHDKQRQRSLMSPPSSDSWLKAHQRTYQRWLRRARTEDLSDIASLKALYQTGVDNYGRPVVVIVGRNIPIPVIDPEKALLYFIHVMDHVASRDYILVYFHTLTSEANQPDAAFLRTVYNTVDLKYRKNLKAFYIVHPTFLSKVMTWFFTTFTASGLKAKVHSVQRLQQLFAHIPPEQIDIPPFVLDHDLQANRAYYTDDPSGHDL
ncbi:ganglioside-induced differentiation-associated protein 2 [Lampetra fluviatilis]